MNICAYMNICIHAYMNFVRCIYLKVHITCICSQIAIKDQGNSKSAYMN